MKLDTGDIFPSLSGMTINGELQILPQATKTEWTVILGYRAHWWPYCIRQLAEFEEKLDQFSPINASVYAYSTDSIENTKAMIEKHGFTMPILAQVNGPEMVEKQGVYYEERRNILHANSFVLKDDKVISLTISNGPIGRMTASDALGMIKFLQK